MNRQVKPRQSKRVCDYFVVVGCGDEIIPLGDDEQLLRGIVSNIAVESLENVLIEPTIINRYPQNDHDDLILPQGIPLFCFPTGFRLSTRLIEPKFHSFVITTEEGLHVLGCCLHFHEELSSIQRSSLLKLLRVSENQNASVPTFFVPKCLCLISNWPFVTAFKEYLCEIYRISTSDTSIPIERYICNFIDDVPSPPSGRVDVTYFLLDTPILFRCPAFNQPHAWSGMPIFPLFECLSPENVLKLFTAVLTERQIVFISSQLCLLTYCAEAIVSLIYPITWTHAYIPILPFPLIGVLGAPFPFITGIHSSFLNYECSFGLDCIKVFLDENRIEFDQESTSLPPLPEKRAKKLLAGIVAFTPNIDFSSRLPSKTAISSNTSLSSILESSLSALPLSSSLTNAISIHGGVNGSNGNGLGSGNGNLISLSSSNSTSSISTISVRSNSFDGGSIKLQSWSETRLPTFDLAYSKENEEPLGNIQVEALREVFLKFFVAILKNYRKYMIYGSEEDPNPLVNFRFQNFLQDQPADWHPFLKEMIDTQSFSQFLDERLSSFEGDRDVIFFDESIDAKMNRYTFKTRNIDTPFLSSGTHKYLKTYVAPSVNTSLIEYSILQMDPTIELKRKDNTTFIKYKRFPVLRDSLYSTSRQLVISFDNYQMMMQFNRLKRINRSTNTNGTNGTLCCYPASVTFSTYLIALSQYVGHCIRLMRSEDRNNWASTHSTAHLLGELRRSASMSSTSTLPPTSLDTNSISLPSLNDGYSTPSKKIAASSIALSRSPSKINFGIIETPTRRRPTIITAVEENIFAAAKLSIQIAFEVLDCLSKMDESPDEFIFRGLIDICGYCGEFVRAVDLLLYMNEEGYLPDRRMLNSLAIALSLATSKRKLEASKDKSMSVVLPGLSRPLSVPEIWSINDWSSLRKGEPTLVFRSVAGSQTNSLNSPNAKFMNYIFGSSAPSSPSPSSFGGSSNSIIPSSPLSSITPIMASSSSPSRSQDGVNRTPTSRGNSNTNNSNSNKKNEVSSSMNFKRDSSQPMDTKKNVASNPWWSSNILEGIIPTLQWKDLDSPDRIPVFACSARLHRQMSHCERLLSAKFPDLEIDFTIRCTGLQCTLDRSLTIAEIYQGMDENANNYTTRCRFCGTSFVPRFTVKWDPRKAAGDDSVNCNNSSDASNDSKTYREGNYNSNNNNNINGNNSSGGSSFPLVCELLSPWTLRKEMFTLLFSENDNILTLTARDFYRSSYQRAVLFWNLVVSFRLRGLPFAFLLTEERITEAFPVAK